MSGLSRRELLVAGAAAGLAGTLAPSALGSASSSWLRRSGHAGLEGTTYGAGGVPLRLVSVDGAAEDAFALRFAGPPGLTGGIHELSHPSLGRFALLLGPVGPAVAGQAYEVVVDRRAGGSGTPASGGSGPAPGGSGPASSSAPGGSGPASSSAPGGAASGGGADASGGRGDLAGGADASGGRGDDAAAGGSASGAAASPAAKDERAPAPLVRSATAARRGGVLTADVRVAAGRGLTGVRVRLLQGDVVVATGARRLAGRTKVRLPLRRVRRVPAGELWLEVTVTGRTKATVRRRVGLR